MLQAPMQFNPGEQLGQTITAIGGLGTAAFGLVDALKTTFKSINRIGWKHIASVVSGLTPEGPATAPAAVPASSAPPSSAPPVGTRAAGGAAPAAPALNALPQKSVLDTLEANWVNGNDLTSQKSIAKSLIKLHLSAANASALAAKTSVDGGVLTSVAQKNAAGTPLAPNESDVFARFDLIVTALLDEAYQLSDQVYRNGTRTLAAVLAVVLALAGGAAIDGLPFWTSHDLGIAIVVGILATPLAPIAKDLSTALATAVNTMQALKKPAK
jgi:hypothetical protein